MPFATNPQPLGQLKPGADFATKSVPVTKNLDLTDLPGSGLVEYLAVRAHPDNTGRMFIVSDDKQPAADFSNVIDVVEAGGKYSTGSRAGTVATVDPLQYNVAMENADDFAIGEVRVG